MEEAHRRFDSCVVLRKLHEDDLGRLYRAAAIEGDAAGRRLWLRTLDGPGIPRDAVVAALDGARLIAQALTDPQLPPHPRFPVADGVPAIAWEHTVGQPLNRTLAQARDEAFPVQPDNALLIVSKLARTLATVRAVTLGGRKVNHGCLHPGLIMLSHDGEAVVTGFGLGPALLGSLEHPDGLAGARAYLAPEVLDNHLASAAGDVYSLGALLFHLLTGTALPTAADQRPAAVDAALLAWDGEPIPADIRGLLLAALEPAADRRIPTAAALCPDIESLVYGGAYSPTTFNLALFMDRLFRVEFDADEAARASDEAVDLAPLLAEPPAAAPPKAEPLDDGTDGGAPRRWSGGRRAIWVVLGAVAAVAFVATGLWIGRGVFAPPAPVPTPTPTAAEIAALRQVQEDRLRTMTQAMVQEMMAEKETEIRHELMARQQRIEELQGRLLLSERRAAQSAAAAAEEAATQQALLAEIEAQERAQQEQQEALEAEARQARTAADEAAVFDQASAADAAVPTNTRSPLPAGPVEPQATRSPTRVAVIPPVATAAADEAAGPALKPGDFVGVDDVDSAPVVIKNQPLNWPRTALLSGEKGVVVVRVTVNSTGGVDDAEILRADHRSHGIPEAAADAAAGYRFKPGIKNGVPVTTHAFITWRYDFTDR